MATIGLVACAAAKQAHPATAESIYISDLFQKSRSYVQSRCDRWYILSAKHGLLKPDKIIDPYNVTLKTMPKRERIEWAKSVLASLITETRSGDTLIFLAGNTYREGLTGELLRRGYKIEVPMDGLRIGEQLSWLKSHLPSR